MLRHKRLVDVGDTARLQARSSSQHQHQPRHQRQDHQRLHHQVDRHADDNDDLEDRWRQAAQMLTDDDELDLFIAKHEHDQQRSRRQTNLPINRAHNKSPTQRSEQRGQALITGRNRSTSPTSDLMQQLEYHQQRQSQPAIRHNRTAVADEQDDDGCDDEDDEDDDDNSSISFAQSGCHSILSAWRLKSAAKARRQQQQQQARPTSVLSMASSSGKKSVVTLRSMGKSPASQTRIPLGPRAAQHFVTNSQRRRRANELILSTMEARRRALQAARQNTASLYGSQSYLADAGSLLLDQATGGGGGSLSPSPLGRRHRTPSPLIRGERVSQQALSDLGGRQSAAVLAQRQRLLLDAAETAAGKSNGKASALKGRVPLAKLDQNSSDLCSSNSSSDDDSSSSSGSKFTQLVTSELAPDCILLDEQAIRLRRQQPHQLINHPAQTNERVWQTSSQQVQKQPARPQTKPKPARSPVQQVGVLDSPPKPPERQRRNKSSATVSKRQQQSESCENLEKIANKVDEPDDAGGRLRRGALRRDSIRRLRLNRAQSMDERPKVAGRSKSSEATSNSYDESSTNESSSAGPVRPKSPLIAGKLEALPKSRRSDIESNPFLNRGHFRHSTSARSGSNGQQSAAYEDGVHQVERMIRQMKPNQVFSSHATSDESMRSQQMNSTSSNATKPTSSKQPSTSGSKSALTSHLRNSPQPSGQSTSGTTRPNDRRNMMVKTGVKSQDDLQFDVLGNRKQYELEERWRHEKSPPGSSNQEERLMSERVEIMRSCSISPPVGFADPDILSAPQQHQQQPQPQFRRAFSEERPKVAARRRPDVSEQVSSSEKPQQVNTNDRPETSGSSVNLPKFERTADDEFRKRVDYLRKLARVNIAANVIPSASTDPPRSKVLEPPRAPKPGVVDQPARVATQQQQQQQQQQSKQPLVKPLSTNWRGLEADSIEAKRGKEEPKREISSRPTGSHQTSQTSSLFDERARWNVGPPVNRAANAKGVPQVARVASTNLDALLADRYQTRQRSSSPLFSDSGSRLSESARQRELTSSAVVKLVVKEKSAPKLDYALMEQQQQPVGRQSVVSSQPASPRQSLPTKSQQQKQQQIHSSALGQAAVRPKSPVRVASPRSPEFTAASSNDDSAIASSVSSPSLSFMMNPNQQQQAALGKGTTTAMRSQVEQAAGCQRQQQQQPQTSSPPKRVHFNDRTSVRSFESISSLASNSTAVPNDELSVRQQVGSPDSMGSGSTSRLSAESPDLRRGGGAAIYAVRGDPELEFEGGQQPFTAVHPHRQQQSYVPVHNLSQPYALAPTRSYELTGSIIQSPQQQQHHRQMPFIRMTAPPMINTSSNVASPPTIGNLQQQQQQHNIQYLVQRPTLLRSTQIAPTQTAQPQLIAARQADNLLGAIAQDDEDPNYTLRLRQAATSRVFSYAPPNQPPLPPNIPAHKVNLSNQQQLSPPPPKPATSTPVASNQRRRQDLSNFQTEV